MDSDAINRLFDEAAAEEARRRDGGAPRDGGSPRNGSEKNNRGPERRGRPTQEERIRKAEGQNKIRSWVHRERNK